MGKDQSQWRYAAIVASAVSITASGLASGDAQHQRPQEQWQLSSRIVHAGVRRGAAIRVHSSPKGRHHLLVIIPCITPLWLINPFVCLHITARLKTFEILESQPSNVYCRNEWSCDMCTLKNPLSHSLFFLSFSHPKESSFVDPKCHDTVPSDHLTNSTHTHTHIHSNDNSLCAASPENFSQLTFPISPRNIIPSSLEYITPVHIYWHSSA